MFNFKKEITKERNRIATMLEALEQVDCEPSPGSLMSRGGEGRHFRLRIRRRGESGAIENTYVDLGSATDSKTVSFALKDYYHELKKRVEQNKKTLDALEKRFVEYGVENNLAALSKEHQRVLGNVENKALLYGIALAREGHVVSGDGAGAQSNSASRSATARSTQGAHRNATARSTQGAPLPFRKDTATSIAAEGTVVRSKSEAIILTLLKSHGIEFEYEYPLALTGLDGYKVRKYPDFYIKTKRGPVIWEHLGMLKSDTYFEGAAEKLRLYWHNGFLPGISLIVTCDSPDGGIDVSVIEEIIERTIAPYV